MIYTTISVSGLCPHLNIEISLTGKYEVVDDTHLRFCSFRCPIEENAKLDHYEQQDKYKYLKPCDNVIDCPIAKQFQTVVSL